MPYYGRHRGTASGVTMYSGIVPTYAAGPGYSLLATCPAGRQWKVQSVWMQNNHSTKNYIVGLSRRPAGWPVAGGGDPLFRVFTSVRLVPEELVVFSEVIGMRAGDSLWGFELEADAGDPSSGPVNMFIAGEETYL